MEGISLIIPVYNKIDVTLRCIDHVRKKNPGSGYEIIVMDNASSDPTQDVLSRRPDITYIRNNENLGMPGAYNIAALRCGFPLLCFMHNDVFVHEDAWLLKLARFLSETPDAGIVGLYGSKTMRRDGSFRGTMIVHSKQGSSTMRKPFEKVAVVDGLLLAATKEIFYRIKGFQESFTIHYYDKDISMRALDCGLTNYVLNIPFDHKASTSRSALAEDITIRRMARDTFLKIWADRLPADVTTWQERMRAIFSSGKRS